MRKILYRIIVLMFVISLVVPTSIAQAKVLAAPAPTLLAPANQSVVTHLDTPNANPVLSWNPVTGAIHYRVQISSDAAFTSPQIYIVQQTVFTTFGLSDGDWYWRVQATDNAGDSPFSQIWKFTKAWGNANNRPIPLAPANNTTINEVGVFSWEPVVGATHYQIVLYRSGFYQDFTSSYTYLTIPSSLPNGVYSWNVTAWYKDWKGATSETFTFTLNFAPTITLLEPANGATVNETPLFRWQPMSGVRQYQLQISTSPTFSTVNYDFTVANNNVRPEFSMMNDQNMYWRVRGLTSTGMTDWSQTRVFIRRWVAAPTLLTPLNGGQNVLMPYFSWTPVAGAAKYHIQVATDVNFGSIAWEDDVFNTHYYKTTDWLLGTNYYWRVYPIDYSNIRGAASSTFYFKFVPHMLAAPAQQIFPLFYYTPSTTMNPVEDRTVAYPVFMWTRTLYPNADATINKATEAPYYKVEVANRQFSATNPPAILWDTITENMTATPTFDDPFPYQDGMTYFWRVYPLDASLNPLVSTAYILGWKFRIDTSNALDGAVDTTPVLISPANEGEAVETWPLFQWQPVAGVDSYTVEISDDPNFANLIIGATVAQPFYAPTTRPSLEAGGIYYWRVRSNNAEGISQWSETRTVFFSRYPQWAAFRARLGSIADGLIVGQDQSDGIQANFNLTNLFASNGTSEWRVGLEVPADLTGTETFAVYFDTDRKANSGATSDPYNYQVDFGVYRPEFALYFPSSDLFTWDESQQAWDDGQSLYTLGGDIEIGNGNTAQFEFVIPSTVIDMNLQTGALNVVVASYDNTPGSAPKDILPAPSTNGRLDRMISLSQHLTAVSVPEYALVKTSNWNRTWKPIWLYANPKNRWEGFSLEVNTTPDFNGEAYYAIHRGEASPYGMTYNEMMFEKNNTYYWHIAALHRDGYNYTPMAWGGVETFQRDGFRVENFKATSDTSLPILSWDKAEGASDYIIQVSGDPSFTSNLYVSATTSLNSWVFNSGLAEGMYYARIAMRRGGVNENAWSDTVSFRVSYPAPTNLRTIPSLEANVYPVPPMLCWDRVVADSFIAMSYQVQMSSTPNFSSLVDNFTIEGNCWQPSGSYADGPYYWRVATVTGSNHTSQFSESKSFTKQYPSPSHLNIGSFANGRLMMLEWDAVEGAANYYLEVAADKDFTRIIESATVDNPFFFPQQTYPTMFYWRVAMVDRTNKRGPFSSDVRLGNQHTTYLPMVIKP